MTWDQLTLKLKDFSLCPTEYEAEPLRKEGSSIEILANWYLQEILVKTKRLNVASCISSSVFFKGGLQQLLPAFVTTKLISKHKD